MFSRTLKQTATYWHSTGTGLYGNPSFDDPVQIPCRWEDTQDLFIDAHGRESVSKSKVFFAGEVNLTGYLFKGVSNEEDPTTLSGLAFEIRGVKITPDLRNLKSLTVAIL